ncbi:transcription antitermination factor NusB [Candidatus Chlamydia sanziniae]|uniref:Transcription termination protein NusB n=1 Tax=Candidatus Chlamydia sanziniae TaxID=1806891 RepID=A0A1A9HUW2_9CHLA|nr:transcription antitermination factor NusB [Candidatus Chlamydia sanziniae]ANH78778.1 Transcription termination protein NusB [Candidatus Chlamydia sanziniae]
MVTPTPEKSLGSYVSLSRALPQQKMREIILQMLYALDMAPSTEDNLVHLLMTEAAVAQKHVLAALNYAKQILEKAPQLDLLIRSVIKSKSFEKLNLMEKNILQLTLFEYFYGQPIQAAILIAEAIRLIKKFSYLEACPFIHAVLNDIFNLPKPTLYIDSSLICCPAN